MKLVINIQNLTITSFKEQHFCSYLTENMTRVNFKKPKSLIYLGKFYTWGQNHNTYSNSWESSKTTNVTVNGTQS